MRRQVNFDASVLDSIGAARRPSARQQAQQPQQQQQQQPLSASLSPSLSSSSLSSSSLSSSSERRTLLDPNVVASLDAQTKHGSSGFMSRVKSSSFYVPLLLASFGGLLGGILCNWHYVENPPQSCGSEQACAKDRRERTMTAFIVGAIAGVFLYLYFFVRSPTSSISQQYELPEAREDEYFDAGDDYDGEYGYDVDE